MDGSRGRRMVALLGLVAMLTLTACGSTADDIRNHLNDNYELVNESGKYAQYRADDPVERVGAAITSVARPGRNHQDDTGLYLGYEDLMVHIDQASTGGSDIEVTDAKDGYNRWGPAIIPIWGTYGGSYRNAFSGGGPGFGK